MWPRLSSRLYASSMYRIADSRCLADPNASSARQLKHLDRALRHFAVPCILLLRGPSYAVFADSFMYLLLIPTASRNRLLVFFTISSPKETFLGRLKE